MVRSGLLVNEAAGYTKNRQSSFVCSQIKPVLFGLEYSKLKGWPHCFHFPELVTGLCYFTPEQVLARIRPGILCLHLPGGMAQTSLSHFCRFLGCRDNSL
jgi:hypothetical protein